MKRRIALAAGLVLTGMLASGAAAQTGRLALEARTGVSVPRGDLKDGGASTAFSAGLDAMYNFGSMLTGYVGVSRDEFDGSYSSQGGQAGLKLLAGSGSVMPWLSGGVIMQKLYARGAKSDLSLGFEGGGGIDFAVTESFTLAPGVRYRTYDAQFDPGELSTRYFTVNLGAHLHLR